MSILPINKRNNEICYHKWLKGFSNSFIINFLEENTF